MVDADDYRSPAMKELASLVFSKKGAERTDREVIREAVRYIWELKKESMAWQAFCGELRKTTTANIVPCCYDISGSDMKRGHDKPCKACREEADNG